MNFLAHSLFGYNDSGLITGQFCGDFVRGSDLSMYPERVEQGIRLHRRMDQFTDQHPALQEARNSFERERRRFAGIVIDVLFDHYLAINWSELHSRDLNQHADDVQTAVAEHQHVIPDEMARFMRFIDTERVLQRNASLAGIELTLSRIAARSGRFAPLAMAQSQLQQLMVVLTEPFDRLYPDLNSCALQFLDRNG